MKTKIVNIFDSNTGLFVEACEAHESPEEPGVFHAPIYSTEDPLPTMSDGQVAVRCLPDGAVPNNGMDGAWVIKDDHIGETWYDKISGAAVVIDSLDISSNLAATKPVALLLKEAKQDKLAELSAACVAQIYEGFNSSALGAPYLYPAKDKDQANLSASVTASLIPSLPANWSTDFWCADSEGVWALRPHTAVQIQQVGLDGKAAIGKAIKRNADQAGKVIAIMDSDSDWVGAINSVVW